MIGKPKYKLGDVVTFSFVSNGPQRTGTIVVVDAFGTWTDDSDVCYDICCENEGWFKHVPEYDILNEN